jgi:hypothetical protein
MARHLLQQRSLRSVRTPGYRCQFAWHPLVAVPLPGSFEVKAQFQKRSDAWKASANLEEDGEGRIAATYQPPA